MVCSLALESCLALESWARTRCAAWRDRFADAGMWTIGNRCRYDRDHLRYPSDLADAEWVLTAPLIPPAKHGGRRREVDRRATADGIMHVLPTGCQWRAIPKDPPPRSTVHGHLGRWQWGGASERIHDALYVQCRELAGREASPTVAIIDRQSVKSAEKGRRALIRRARMRVRRSRARSAISLATPRACC